MMDCALIATGHYAQVRQLEQDGRWVVSRGLDPGKDQSYVLWGLEQKNLARTRFPIGSFRKSEIRQMAVDSGFPELATKSESYEICFIPDNDYRGFLKRKEPEATAKLAHGKLVGVSGDQLGEHDGYPFFTIGQRKGLGIATGEPLYVTDIQPATNTVVLGRKEDLQKQTMWVRRPNFQMINALKEQMEAVTKIRYKDKGTPSTLSMDGDRVKIEFHAPVAGIAPGQSAVFYVGDDVVGGGFIDRP
jgi:tRNA-specific 2-thiouridylase